MKIDWSNFNSGLLIEVTRRSGVFTASAVAINAHTIITAAHCLEGEILQIRVSNQPSYQIEGEFFEVDWYELHPDYDPDSSNYQNDLAKIKLKKPLPVETQFFPIIKSVKEFSGKIFRVGYGARNNQNIRTLITPELRQVHALEKTLELDDVFSFAGDSGGPIFVQQKGQLYLVAIHSTLSHGPEGKFSFNPLLSPHREWIVC